MTAFVRLRHLDTPLERDEGEYGYMGQLINQGVPPYVEAYNMKLPGTYAMYALFLRLFGDDARGIRIGLLLANAASVVLLFMLARLVASPAGAVAGAAAFAALALSPRVLGTYAHATHFVVLFALAGLVCVAHAIRRGRPWEFAGAGVLLGLSILMKQNGVFFAALAFALVGWTEWRAGSVRRGAIRLGLLATGVLIPLGLTALALWRAGAWARFRFWVVDYASAYVSQQPLSAALRYAKFTGGPIVTGAPVLTLIALGGLAVALAQSWRRRRPTFALAFAAVSAAAVCPGFWFRPHYWILLLPAAGLLAALAADALTVVLRGPLGEGGAPAAVAIVLLGAAQMLYGQRVVLFEASPPESSRLVYGDQPFPEAVEVGAYLRDRTTPAERIAVIGSEPEIYFYARRRGATGHIYTYAMMEPQPFAKRMQEEMQREIEAAAPAYVVFVTATSSWMARQDSDLSIVDWANGFLQRRYQRVGVVEIPSDGGPGLFFWDAALRDYRPRWQNRLIVCKRRAPATP